MIRWVRKRSSRSVEFVTNIPNPVEPEFPLKLRLTVYDLLSDDDREKKPDADSRFRAHASFNGTELFRLWAPTVEEAKHRTEVGLQRIVAAFAEEIAESNEQTLEDACQAIPKS